MSVKIAKSQLLGLSSYFKINIGYISLHVVGSEAVINVSDWDAMSLLVSIATPTTLTCRCTTPRVCGRRIPFPLSGHRTQRVAACSRFSWPRLIALWPKPSMWDDSPAAAGRYAIQRAAWLRLMRYAQYPLHTFSRNFPVDGEVANLLQVRSKLTTSRCNGIWETTRHNTHTQLVRDLLWGDWCNEFGLSYVSRFSGFKYISRPSNVNVVTLINSTLISRNHSEIECPFQ